MIKNYFKIAWRNLWKSRQFTIVSISGMVIGMTCFILIALYIQYELSYDKQHEKANRIYRIAQTQKGNDFRGTDQYALAPLPLAPAIKQNFPEVEAATNLAIHEARFFHNKTPLYEEGLYADEHLFEVFSFPIIEGAGSESIADPNSIILTESLAKKYFGNESPIGKTIRYENERSLTVRGITPDVPKNQHFSFTYITSYRNLPWFEDDYNPWASNNYHAYIVLPEGYNYKNLEKKFTVFNEQVEKAYSRLPFKAAYFLQPLADIHLQSHINFELKPNSDIKYIYLAASIAYIILLLALINYINLVIVQFNQRSKEVGVRKVLGANRRQLVFQFLTESFLITIISFSGALILSYALLPQFNNLLDLDIPFNLQINRFIFISLALSAICLSGLSGLYPAIYSSLLSPVNSLKGKWAKNGSIGVLLRNSLVFFQFTAAIVLIVGSIIILSQLSFIQNKKLGFQKNQIVYIPYQQLKIFDKSSAFRHELLKNPNILDVSISSDLPLNSTNQGIANKWEGNTDEKELFIYRTSIDYNYIDLFRIEMAEGRNFSTAFPTDSSKSYILNEAAVNALGWNSAIGRSFEDGTVVGVVKNFHFQPFNYRIEPMYLKFITAENSYYEGNIILKINMQEKENTLAYIQKTMSNMFPDTPFDYHYFDESYNELYQSETRFGWIINLFTFIAIFIASIGLLGLINQKISQRIKEIGIRKVLGASVAGIIALISKGFIKLVFLAILVACPIAYFLGNLWLQDFAYRIEISWWYFVLAGILILLIASVAIGVRAIRAANVNPVKNLRTE